MVLIHKTVEGSDGYVCYHCARVIRGPLTLRNPGRLARQAGDFMKAYHPKCYAASEKEAEKELHGKN